MTFKYSPAGGNDPRFEHERTERIRAQEALRESGARFRSAFEMAGHGMALLSLDNKWLTVDRSICTFIGYGEEELLGRDFDCITYPDDPQTDPVQMRRLVAGEIPFFHIEKRYSHKDGHAVWVLIGFSLVTDARQNPLYVVAQIQDITRRKTAESHADEAHARLIDALESVPTSFMLYDMERRLILWNSKTPRFFPEISHMLVAGARIEDLFRARIEKELPGIPSERIDKRLERRLERFNEPGAPVEEKLADGRWAQTIERRMTDGGTVCISIDITERKRGEKALREAKDAAEFANRSKSEFLANMSHELRTPLNTIIGFSDMLKSEMFGPMGDARYKEYAQDINQSGSHLLELINDVLDLSKVEAGVLTLVEEAVDIDQTVRACARMIEEPAHKSEIRVSTNVPANFPALMGDRRHLKQILLNLLSNAVKFTPPGGRVSIDAALDELGAIMVTVRDTGVGIAHRDISRVLEPFMQVDNVFTRRHKGTGLGLPLAKSLTELHDGMLTISSEIDKGTTITLRFPRSRTKAIP